MASPLDTGSSLGTTGSGGVSLRMSSRTPSWRERENNKRRERRRRAIAAKIFAGLRAHGNFSLPKHCDNNEVLKALCREAGWTVDADGTTYRQGCSRPVEPMDIGISASPSPCSSSKHQSPCVSSFNPSPTSSSFPSPSSSPYTNLDGASLIPWLKNLSSQSPYMNLYGGGGGGGSISAPVTPPISSPTSRAYPQQFMMGGGHYTNLPYSSSTPPSPGDQSSIPVSQWFSGIQQVLHSQGPSPSPSQPTSPTFSLISANPFGIRDLGLASTHNAAPGVSTSSHVNEFAFGGASSSKGLVKAWAGEEIVVHEDIIGSDDLELTLGGASSSSSRPR